MSWDIRLTDMIDAEAAVQVITSSKKSGDQLHQKQSTAVKFETSNLLGENERR